MGLPASSVAPPIGTTPRLFPPPCCPGSLKNSSRGLETSGLGYCANVISTLLVPVGALSASVALYMQSPFNKTVANLSITAAETPSTSLPWPITSGPTSLCLIILCCVS